MPGFERSKHRNKMHLSLENNKLKEINSDQMRMLFVGYRLVRFLTIRTCNDLGNMINNYHGFPSS